MEPSDLYEDDIPEMCPLCSYSCDLDEHDDDECENVLQLTADGFVSHLLPSAGEILAREIQAAMPEGPLS